MPESIAVQVVHRNLRWEVRVNGVARRYIDWLCTKERAIEHAHERAIEVGATSILVERAGWVGNEVIHVAHESGTHRVARRSA